MRPVPTPARRRLRRRREDVAWVMLEPAAVEPQRAAVADAPENTRCVCSVGVKKQLYLLALSSETRVVPAGGERRLAARFS